MDNKNKIYRRSGITIACYVFAVILLIYTCYNAGTVVNQINEYYESYGMSAKPMEYITYVAQNAMPSLVYTVTIFMLGYILDAVRKTDPKNYMTEEEYADAKAAKKEAKEAKKFAKGEKAAAKAGLAASEEDSVASDFAKDLDKELKADEKKGEFKKAGGNRKNYNASRNGNYNHRQSGNRNGGNRNGNGNGNRRNNNQNNSQNNHYNNQNNQNNNQSGQNKPKVEEKKVTSEQEKPADVFEVKITEE